MKISRLLCDKPETVISAVAQLSKAGIIFLDCEGKDLGAQGGLLSTLGVGIYNGPDNIHHDDLKGELIIYLFDVLAFHHPPTPIPSSHRSRIPPVFNLLKPLFDILASPNVLKVGFDLRMDASELFHGHGVRLTHVLDLQVADVLSRHGEDETTALQRLVGRFLPVTEVLTHRGIYKHVVKINGLDAALIDQGYNLPRKKKVDHSMWLRRPLDEEHLLYAAEDIRLIHSLYIAILENGNVDLRNAMMRSERYIQQHVSSRPSNDDIYIRHGLMPLDGFDDMGMNRVRLCVGCRRSLPNNQFPTLKMGVGIAYCFVCYAVKRRTALREKRKSHLGCA